MILRFLTIVLVVLLLPGTASQAAPLSAHDVSVGQRMFAFIARDQWDKAEHVAQDAKEPLLRTTLTWYRLRFDERGVRFSDYQRFLEQYPDWPHQTQLIRLAEQKITPATASRDLMEWFQKFPPQTTAGRLAYLDALQRTGADKAFIKQLVKTTWADASFSRASEQDFLAEFGGYLTQQDHIARMNRLLWESRLTEAERLMSRVGSEYAAVAKARIALQKRAPGVDKLTDNVPARLQNDPGLVYERARWRRRAGNDAGAMQLILSAPTLTSHYDRWWREQEYHVRQALKNRSIKTAYRLASEHQMPAGSVSYAEAEFLAGWLALEYMNKPDKAYPHFVNIINNVTTPISQARGLFWAGKAALRLDNKSEAETLLQEAARHSVTFYGQQAASKIDAPVTLQASVAQPPDNAAFNKHPLVRVVRLLVQLGETRRIDPFILALAQQNTGSFAPQALRLAHDLRRYDLSVALAKQSKADGMVWPDYEFPLIELPDMARAPEAALIYAIIRQESVFNPGAVSPVGARGMMQLMPATAKSEARLMKVPYSLDRLTRDAHYNIRLGSHHLSRLVENYDGAYPLAIAAYNAGSTNVNRWLREYGDPRQGAISYINWMESIPFRETRNYVHRVLEGVDVYRLRLESNPDYKIPLTEAYAWCSVTCPIVERELQRASLNGASTSR